MKRVIIESPYAGNGATPQEIEENVEYARACLRDSLNRGEAPFASHLLYTQEGVLDDTIPHEREMGIQAGLHWGSLADETVVYTDLGISPGMRKGIRRAQEEGRPVIHRNIRRKRDE